MFTRVFLYIGLLAYLYIQMTNWFLCFLLPSRIIKMIIDYFFFWGYSFFRTNRQFSKQVSAWGAISYLALPFMVTLGIVLFPLHLQLPSNIILSSSIIFILYLLICYLMFIRKKRYLVIEERFKRLSPRKQYWGTRGVVFYIVFSLVFYVFITIKYS